MSLSRTQAIEKVRAFEKSEGYAPDSLVNVIYFESGLNPQAKNKLSGAVGLIQWTVKTASGLGTSTSEILAMSFDEQLKLIKKYLDRNGYSQKLRQSTDWLDYYCAVLYPALIGKPDSAVMARKGNIVYTQNTGLDYNKDGVIDKGDIRKRFAKSVNAFRESAGMLPNITVANNTPLPAMLFLLGGALFLELI